MNSRNKFIIGILVMLTVVLVIEYRMPRHFQWQPTFSHVDPQPFGCLVFDSVMKATMPNGYAIENRSLRQIFADDSVATSPKSILIITNESFSERDCNYILQLASEGHTLMVATSIPYDWSDTLGFDTKWNSLFRLQDVAGKAPSKALVAWEQDSLYAHHPLSLHVYSQMIERTMQPSDSIPSQVLMTFVSLDDDEDDDDEDVEQKPNALAVSYPIGKGEFILVSAPLLLTNYTMVSSDGWVLIGRLMDRLKQHPVIRTEAYMSITAQQESTPFYVFLREPPLRWALYLTLLAILLFCIFTARRRQRAIPVVQKPQNHNLEFVRLIGTLYWQDHWNPGLLAKKLSYTTEEIRRQTGIDITVSDSAPNGPIARLARHTGIDEQELTLLLKNIREAASGNYIVTDAELKTYIKELNRIQQSL